MTLSVSTSGKQNAVLTTASPPAGTTKYKIERKLWFSPSVISDVSYLEIAETTNAVYNDYPRPLTTGSTPVNLRIAYKVTPFASGSYGTAVEATNTDEGFQIASVTDAQITSSGALGSATSAGTFSNTYLAQAESKPTGSTNSDQESWVITEILPLTASSV